MTPPLLLFPLLVLAAPQEPVPISAVPLETDPEVVEEARKFALDWGIASYRILNEEAEIGLYVQSNVLTEEGKNTYLQLFDSFVFSRMQRDYTFRTACNLTTGYPVRGFLADLEFGKVAIRFSEGRAKGQHMFQTPVDVEVPEDFVTAMTLLRGLGNLEFEAGWTRDCKFIDIREFPEESGITDGNLTCIGAEKLEFEGQEFDSWKFKFVEGEERPVFLWYSPEGHLLQRVHRRETWKYSPSRTEAQRGED